MNRPAFFDSVGDRLAGLIRHGILADERPEERPESMTTDVLSAPLGSSRQAGDAASRARSIAGRLEVTRAGAAFPGASISAIGDGVMCNVTPLIPDH